MHKKILMLVLVALLTMGCSSNKQLTVGSAVGGTAGALVGGMIGGMFGLLASGGGVSNNADSLALGGLVVGGVTGAVLGASVGGGIQTAVEK